jgi:polyphosphate kinase
MASADLMTRNLDRRVEVGFPISDERHKAFVLSYLEQQWDDHTKSRWIDLEGKNEYRQGKGREAQETLFELLEAHMKAL